MAQYIGRFAPSPTGALHAGSLVAALASWLDARAQGGQWLVRIEDVDTPRCIAGAAEEILRQLACCGLIPDAPPVYQSQRGALYQAALDELIDQQRSYPCSCSRKDIEAAWAARGDAKPRHAELVYPGTCRAGLQGREARAWRFFIGKEHFSPVNAAWSAIKSVVAQDELITWQDRRLGQQMQDVSTQIGDFVLKRSDGLWAYQLAVVVDDAKQGITHIVRGEDLADNTARQILLQQALRYPTPEYLHSPLVFAADGQKLSKQNGATPLTLHSDIQALNELNKAADCLQLPAQEGSLSQALSSWKIDWRLRWDFCNCPIRRRLHFDKY